MDIPVTPGIQGQSLLPLIRGHKESVRDFAISSLTYVQDAEVRCPTSFRTKDHLYIYGGDEWESELYDLQNDPEETRNIFDSHTDVAEGLHRQYLDFLREISCPGMSLEARQEFNPTPRADVPYRKIL
jgi:hypothetical protein